MTSVVQGRERTPRIPELDGLRGIAVGIVLLWHFVGALMDPSLGSWTKAVYNTTILGRTGVDLFFVLSGFLITGIILDKSQAPSQFLKHFYIRRVLRIVPSYALLILVFWLAIVVGVDNYAFNSETPWWRHATFTQNLWMAEHDRWGPGAVSVTWSVAIEEQFYLLFPLMALLVPRRLLPALFVSIALFSCIFRAAAYLDLKSVYTMYVHTLSRLDGLAMGGLIAWLWRQPRFDEWLTIHARAFKRWCIFLCLCIPLLGIGMADNLARNMATWGHTYLTFFYGTTLVVILRSLNTGNVEWLRNRNLGRLGAVSYTVYLFHPLLLSSVFLLAKRPERLSAPIDVVLSTIALVLTLVWSAVSLRWLEMPLTQAGRRWRY